MAQATNKLILLGSILLISIPCFSQLQATSLHKANKLYNEAEQLFDNYQDSLALIKFRQARAVYLTLDTIVPNLAEACLGMGILYQTAQEFTQAIDAYKQYIFFSKKLTPDIDSIFFEPLVLIGYNFVHLNQFDSAYMYYSKAETLLTRYPHLPSTQTLRFYNEMGFLFLSSGNYIQAINHYEKALSILDFDPINFDKQETDAINRFVTYTNNIANSLSKLGRKQEAIDKLKELTKYHSHSEALYQHIANLYLQLEKPDSAKTYLEKIDTRVISNSEKTDYYNNFGTVNTLTANYTEALVNFNKAKEISLSIFGKQNDLLALAYSGKAKVYELQKKYPNALAQYQLAIQSLHFDFNSADIYQNPTDVSHAASPLLLFKTLQQKAHAFRQYFTETKKITDLEASLQTYELAFELADRIRKSYDSDEAKLFFTNTVAPVYEEAVSTAYQLYTQTGNKSNLQSAFALAEQSKAAVLTESLRELEIKQVPGIPEALLRKEKELKLNISALNIRMVETTDSASKEAYRNRLRDNEIELAKTLKEFESNKQYYQLKYDTSSVHISQLQTMLDSETALVEYFVGKQHVYVFVVTQENFHVKQIPLATTFKQDWQALYQNLYEAKAGSRYKGDAPAHRLFTQVFLPIKELVAGNERLILIPDKELSYLPFEALAMDEKASQYLIHDYSISYAYSGKLLQNAVQQSYSPAELSVLSMAPFVMKNTYGQSLLRGDVLDPLYASREEVQQVGGQVYLEKAATKEEFLRQAAKYDIIHLATHAKADNQDPLHSFIAFYPHTDSLSSYRLYAQELYNLHLNKLKLIVLSACETNSGKLIQGEGVMSLARAFAYAGCPSIVTTLWKAEDKTTADISVRMHQYLKEGKPKDEALRLAKLDYINGQTHASRRSPIYWANFIFIGDHTALYKDTSYPWWLLSSLIAGILAVAVWFYIKHHTPRKALQ